MPVNDQDNLYPVSRLFRGNMGKKYPEAISNRELIAIIEKAKGRVLFSFAPLTDVLNCKQEGKRPYSEPGCQQIGQEMDSGDQPEGKLRLTYTQKDMGIHSAHHSRCRLRDHL